MPANILPVRPDDPLFDRSTLARCQLKVARLYLSRAHRALSLAREARLAGRDVHGHLARAAFWRRFAREWIDKTVQP